MHEDGSSSPPCILMQSLHSSHAHFMNRFFATTNEMFAISKIRGYFAQDSLFHSIFSIVFSCQQ